MHAHEMYAYEMHARKVHVYETRPSDTPVRCTHEVDPREIHGVR